MESLSLDIMAQSVWQVGTVVIGIIVFTVALEALLYVLLVKTLKHKYALPFMLMAPAAVGLFALVIYPIGYELTLSMSNMSLDNFKRSYSITAESIAKLQEEGVPETVLARLQGLGEQEFSSETELVQTVETIIGTDTMAAHQEEILKSAHRSERFTLTAESLQRLREQNISAEIIATLEKLGSTSYSSERNLLKDVAEALDTDVPEDVQALITTSAEKTTTLKITKRSLFTLRNILPEEALSRLEEEKGLIDKIYTSEKAFLADLEEVVGTGAVTQYQTAFLEHGLANPGPKYGVSEGLANFKTVFTKPVLKQMPFFPVLWRTILWTAIQVPTHVILGLGLAMLMNRPIKFRGLYRTLIIVPWAIPQVIAVLAWRGEFDLNFGFMNIMLTRMGFEAIPWKTDPFWNFAAINITNIWLGVPFMMVILLGGLQSISGTFYEAADVDGATKWDKFRHITLPLIQPVMTPAVILGVIWTFNNFNVPFLLNQNELESSDILVTALFRAAFEYNRYGFAAAFAVVIFIILLAFCLVYMKVVKLDLGVTAGRKKKA